MSTGTVRPIVAAWLSIDDPPALVGERCRRCDTVAFPPRGGPCPNPACDADELVPHRLGTRGTIWSYTDAHYQPPAPYVVEGEYEPFALAAVELPDDGLVVLGQLARGYTVADLAVGAPVELVVEPLYERDGDSVMVWKWRPVGGDQRV